MFRALRYRKCLPSVFTLRSYEIDEHWFWIEKYLQAVEEPDWSLDQVKNDLITANAQLWSLLGERGEATCAVITRVEHYHGTVFGVVWIAAGRGLEHTRVLLNAIEDWFRSMGCSRIELRGRRGWEKVLPDYEPVAVILRKEL